MDNQQGPTVQHAELCSMSCGSLDGSGIWGRRNTCTCMAESLHCSPEAISTLSAHQLYPNTKIKVKKKKDGSFFPDVDIQAELKHLLFLTWDLNKAIINF